MKNIGLTIWFLLVTILSIGQNQKDEELSEQQFEKSDSIPRSVFLDTSTIQHLSLTHEENTKQAWSPFNDSISDVFLFYDIRMKFNSNSKALKFHRKNKVANGMNGEEITNHKLRIEGVDNLLLYGAPAFIQKNYLDPKGRQIYNYLFVVDNYFVKFHISCLLEHEPSYFKEHIISARNKIQSLTKARTN